ncbi:hypothetical protein BC629DRAFT_1499663 [Irpex lacteus]|nr:hypothetical protein BC629DRAFT_1499663 [Irpex lacteus]
MSSELCPYSAEECKRNALMLSALRSFEEEKLQQKTLAMAYPRECLDDAICKHTNHWCGCRLLPSDAPAPSVYVLHLSAKSQAVNRSCIAYGSTPYRNQRIEDPGTELDDCRHDG